MIVIGLIERLEHYLAFGCVKRFVVNSGGNFRRVRAFADVLGQVFRENRIARSEHHCPFQGVLQFAHVAWPGIALQVSPGSRSDAANGPAAALGKPTWILSVTPKLGYRPKDSQAKMFTKLKGKVWIDKGEYHWVRAEGEAIDTLSFGFFLFRVAPGAYVSFEQVRVNQEVWLPSRISVRAEARIALLKKMHAEIDITYKEYKKFQADSKIVAAAVDPPSKKD